MFKKKSTYLVLGLLAIVLFLLLTKLLVGQKPNLLTVTPQPNQEEVSLLPEINLVFSEEVKPEDLIFSAEPNFEYQNASSSDKKTIKLQTTKFLEKNTLYKITISKPVRFSWQFKTRNTEAGSAPGWEVGFDRQEQIYRKAHPQEEALNGLKEKLPYRGENFSVEYVAKTDQFFIYLAKAPPTQIQAEALAWLKARGVNPQSLNIIWFPTGEAIPPRGQ